MKKLLLLIVSVFTCSLCFPQVETNYYTQKNAIECIKDFDAKNCLKSIKQFPPIDLSSYQEDVLSTDMNTEKPFQYCKSLEVNYTLSDGNWVDLESGRLWFLTFESAGAHLLSFVINDFHLPTGASLYIVNQEGTTLYGPVKDGSIQNRKGFLTDAIDGSIVTILLFEPKSHVEKSSLRITRVNHYYADSRSDPTRSGNDCTIDVACIPGWDFEADGIGRLFVLHNDGLFSGSGALVMTADRSFKGYFLTAMHVVDGGTLESVSFFYRRKTCNGNQEYTRVTCYNIVERASWGAADMALLEILDLPTNNQKLTWLGWDRSGNSSYGGYCLHHPYGINPTKISKELDQIGTYSSNSNYWDVTFDVSTTMEGSSGGPLLDSNRRIIGVKKGTVEGGSNDCENLRKIFGKFSKFWTGGFTDNSRLSNWLDPTGTGVFFVNSSRLHSPTLSGPSSICYGSSGTYTLGDLPPNATIIWSQTNLNSGITLPMQIIGDTCAIVTNNSSQSFEGTINAKIELDGYTLVTLKKEITVFGSFFGYYISGSLSSNFGLGVPLTVERNVPTYIETTNFRGMNVSWNTLYTNPTYWYYDGDQVLSLVYPQNGSGPLIVQATAQYGLSNCGNFEIYLYGQSSSYNLNIENGSGMITITLLPNETNNGNMRNVQDWILEIYDSVTGEKKYNKQLTDFAYSIDTIGWKPGVYLVRAIIDNEALSGKIVIK